MKNRKAYFVKDETSVLGLADEEPFYLEDAIGASSASFVSANVSGRVSSSYLDPEN